jgi:ribosomal-protein-alanine N-acetyltransferase
MGGLALVAERDGRVAGYLYARAAADEAEILNLAVAAGDRRGGVGRALVSAALGQMAGPVRQVFLEVRASNETARRFYESLGFREVGHRRRYYRRPREDAIVMSCCVDATGRIGLQ